MKKRPKQLAAFLGGSVRRTLGHDCCAVRELWIEHISMTTALCHEDGRAQTGCLSGIWGLVSQDTWVRVKAVTRFEMKVYRACWTQWDTVLVGL